MEEVIECNMDWDPQYDTTEMEISQMVKDNLRKPSCHVLVT